MGPKELDTTEATEHAWGSVILNVLVIFMKLPVNQLTSLVDSFYYIQLIVFFSQESGMQKGKSG